MQKHVRVFILTLAQLRGDNLHYASNATMRIILDKLLPRIVCLVT